MGLEERRKRERENRRNVILKAARRLFFDRGFKQVTVESIAKKAELSKGSIYLYYNSKEEIYAQILLSDISKFNDRFTGVLKETDDATTALHRFADIYIDFFLTERELFKILMTYMLHTDDMNLPADLNHHIIKTTNQSIDIMEEIFRFGIQRGEFPHSLNCRLSRNAIWGLLNGVISLYLNTGVESKRVDTIRNTVQTGLEIFIQGMRSTESSR